MTRAALATSLLASVLLLGPAGCLEDKPRIAPRPAAPADPVLASAGQFEITGLQTAEELGAGQAIFIRDNFVYMLGDRSTDGTAGPGVIKEYFWSTNDRGERALFPSGIEILLKENGTDIATRPTGLTWHPNFGYWLGDAPDAQGTLYQIDFDRALSQGTLNGCIISTVEDDAGVNGTRPEFITLPGGRVVLATSDSGATGNALRLYDPVALTTAERTSDPGVLFSEAACGPFVQSLEPGEEAGDLYLIQNQTAGLGYRLTRVTLDDEGRIRESETFDFDQPDDELKAFAWLETDRRGRRSFVMLSASPASNIAFGRWVPAPTFRGR